MSIQRWNPFREIVGPRDAMSRLLDEDVVLSMSPHMHLRGKAFRFEVVLPTGKREVLLDVPAYDFNWQTSYLLAKPRVLPAGSVMYCRAVLRLE